jgi:DNA polymerase
MTNQGIEVLNLRRLRSRSSVTKLEAMIRQMHDGRIRHAYKYYGAHTGRWSGAGVQPQNLPRVPSAWGDVDVDLRACFQAPDGYQLMVADLSSIETRVLGWLSECEALNAIFHADLDPYIAFASYWLDKPYDEITKEERQLAKPAVLGCGYMLSGGDVRMDCCFQLCDQKRAEELRQEYCQCKTRGEKYKSGLWGYAHKMGVPIQRKDAHAAVRAYRNEFWEVVDFWREIEDAAIHAVLTREKQTCKSLLFGCVPAKLLWVKLPSGRRLHYLRPRLREGRTGAPELLYTGYDIKGWQHTKLYGGRLTENLVQAISRDVLAMGLLRADRAQLTIVGHCHDEIICEEPKGHTDALDTLIRAMTAPISWAPGLELKAEGYAEKTYRK